MIAAHLAAGTSTDDLYQAQFQPAPHEFSPHVDLATQLDTLERHTTGATDATEARARIGAIARAVPDDTANRRRSTIIARLPDTPWPARLRTAAVEAHTGEVVVFDHTSDTALIDATAATAASCAVPGVWPTVTIHGRPLMDGGTASAAHATLARAHATVIVIAAMTPPPTTTPLPAEVDELAASGSQVVVIGPDPPTRTAPAPTPSAPTTAPTPPGRPPLRHRLRRDSPPGLARPARHPTRPGHPHQRPTQPLKQHRSPTT